MKSAFGNPANRARRPEKIGAEAARLLILVATSLWLAHPYFAPRLIGTGDALWYHHSLADAVTQFRAGVFPVFVGQSDFSFNGSVYPIRAAPYYQYFAGLLDFATRHRLGFFALEHLTAILSIVAGALSAYGALVWIAPRHRWTAAAFALLYVMCPGVAGLFYAQDLYMSGMALPWVPLAFAAVIRTFDDRGLKPVLVLAATVAVLWWAHSPIAFWATCCAALGQIVRLLTQGIATPLLQRCAIGATAFAALAAYPILSVFLLRTPGEAIVPYLMDRNALLDVVRGSFPSSILPLSVGAPNLSFLQLGYSLWILLLMAFIAWLFRPRFWGATSLLAACGFLLVLLFPVPFLTRALWFRMPETIVGMTLYWPMQRFYILIAAATIVCGQRLLAAMPAGSRKVRDALVVILSAMLIWSAHEASKLIDLADRQNDTVVDSKRWSRPENIAIQRHTYGLFPHRPAYFTHGVVDPRMESHLIDPSTGVAVASDYDIHGAAASEGSFKGKIDPNPGILDLEPDLTLRPGRKYLLTFAFSHPGCTGVLQLLGPEFYREYTLPLSGESKAFGSTPESEKSIVVWTTTSDPETIELRFVPTSPGAKPADFMSFATYSLEEIHPDSLPIEVTSLLPFRAKIRSPAAALLETPRMFVPGYVAAVNGRAVPVRKSAEGLVAFAVPPGASEVELRFAGPFLLNLAFWVSFATGLAAMAAAIRSAFHRRAGPGSG